MKKGDVPARKLACRAVFALGSFVFAVLVGARNARAESPKKVEGFELLGSLGYGITYWDLTSNGKQVNPFGVTAGGDFGYTFPFGLRLGTDASYAFGRTKEDTLRTGEVVTTHASSITWGSSIGYDLLLSPFRLRGAADVGLILLLEEGTVAPWMYFGPRIALTWQYRGVELGLQSRWMMWIGTVQVGLMGGTRF
jgi:hypothetical protein